MINERKSISDEQLGAYLDKIIAKKRESLENRLLNCCSCRPQEFSEKTNVENDYCIEEDFSDDISTVEVLKVSQEALKYFAEEKPQSMPSWNNADVANIRVASRPLPMAGFMADSSSQSVASASMNNSDKKDDDDVIPMPF